MNDSEENIRRHFTRRINFLRKQFHDGMSNGADFAHCKSILAEIKDLQRLLELIDESTYINDRALRTLTMSQTTNEKLKLLAADLQVFNKHARQLLDESYLASRSIYKMK